MQLTYTSTSCSQIGFTLFVLEPSMQWRASIQSASLSIYCVINQSSLKTLGATLVKIGQLGPLSFITALAFLTLAPASGHAACPAPAPYIRQLFAGPPSHSRLQEATEQYLKLDPSTLSPEALWQQVHEYYASLEDSAKMTFSLRDGAGKIRADQVIRKGGENEGVYLYHRAGEPRAIKVLGTRLSEDDMESMDAIMKTAIRAIRGKPLIDHPLLGKQSAIYIHSLLKPQAIEIRNAYMAQKLGGAKVYGAGVVWDRQRPFVFLETEWLGHGQASYTLKGLNRTALDRVRQLAQGKSLPEDAADLLVRALEERICPRDPDMILMGDGRLRWIDAGHWEQHPDFEMLLKRFPYAWESARETLKIAFGTKADPRVVKRFTARLKESIRFTEQEKVRILKTLQLP
jgi:hypothetical protein